MIYTVTINPSLDYIVEVDHLTLGMVNRTKKEKIIAGGKGINVSIVLNNLGIENCALGFVAGFTGKEIEDRLKNQGINTDFIRLEKGVSRINVKVTSDNDSEINGIGPDISLENLNELYKKLDLLVEGDILVLAGSIPSCLSQSLYSDIMNKLMEKKIHFVVDATKELLTKSLQYKPFLIKPNQYELGEIFGVQLETYEDVVPYAKKLQEMGAKNVLVSMGSKGAVLVSEDGNVFSAGVPEGNLVNAVGAGDSMVAGFITGYKKTKDYAQAFRLGVCTGSASACSQQLATKEVVNEFLSRFTQIMCNKKPFNSDFLI